MIITAKARGSKGGPDQQCWEERRRKGAAGTGLCHQLDGGGKSLNKGAKKTQIKSVKALPN